MEAIIHRARHLGVALVIAWISLGGAAPAHANGKITWTSFAGQLPLDCDMVDLTIEPNIHPSSVIELVLAANPRTTLWKGLLVPNGFGYTYWLETAGATKQASVTLPAGFLQQGQSLSFMKAGVFGLHTGVYDLGDLGRIPGGARVTFRWIQDQCPLVSAGWIPDESTMPTWLMPGEQRTVTLMVVNVGSTWYPDGRYEIANIGAVDWKIEPMQITTTVDAVGQVDWLTGIKTSQKLPYTFELTAPTTPGWYTLDLTVLQRGGPVGSAYRKQIAVQASAPKPPAPPPPPKLIAVPNLVHLRMADAADVIAKAGLTLFPDVVFAGVDPNRLVAYQWPMPGTLLEARRPVRLGYALPSQTAVGFASIRFVDCALGPLSVYRWDGDRWEQRASLGPSFGDNGICPTPNAFTLDEKLDDAAFNYWIVVDPARCGDPENAACRSYEWLGWGDAQGEVFEKVLP